MKKNFWEILVPTQIIRHGKLTHVRTRYHRVWDAKVRKISGGLTILSPAKGQWLSSTSNLFIERMIPVRIMCTSQEISKIAEMTAEYYNQEAILFYKVSDEVTIFTNKNFKK